MDLATFDATEGPHVHVLIAEPSAGWETITYPLRDSGKVSREVRGSKMRTYEGLFDEFAAVFQFPYYFGENWPAFHECMIELDHLGYDVPGYVVTVRSASELLADERPESFGNMLGLLGDIADSWATPVDEGQWWDRPGRPFHVVLQETPEASETLLTRLDGVDIPVGEVWRPRTR